MAAVLLAACGAGSSSDDADRADSGPVTAQTPDTAPAVSGAPALPDSGSTDAAASAASTVPSVIGPQQASASAPLPSPSPSPTVPARPTVTARPVFGTGGIGPKQPVSITVDDGIIASIKLTNPAGATVDGKLSRDRTTWSVAEPLGYSKTYTATGIAKNAEGRTTPIRGTFRTLKPRSTVHTSITPGDDAVVGVAAPVIVSFDTEPADRAAIAKAVSISTTPKVEGAWVWIQHDDQRWALDYRPAKFWPAGTEVHVRADLYGLDFGGGAYGAADITSEFTHGRNQVVKADVNSHHLRVYRDGKQVASYPASFGKGTTPDTITRSGIHVVNEKFDEKLMSNPKYGYVNLLERWAVRLSNNGEFIHANPSTVDVQGSSNVSHGCVNLSTPDAKAYFDSVIYGDPVEITGTSIELGPSDGDIFDWSYSWPQWKSMEASTAE